ncbi:MAG: nuclear transport factor 2 family protein [Saprospiraceae bacterium]|nr:nuclear transport factor 2 family protein [Saprospiraceae bacterium]
MHKFFTFLLLASTFMPVNANACPRTWQKDLPKNAWLVSGSAQELKSLIHPDLRYTHSNCWTEEMDEFLSKPEEKGLLYKSIEVDSAAYLVADRTGLVRGKGTFNINHKGKDLSIHLCFTETYVCQDGQWMLFARHAAKL